MKKYIIMQAIAIPIFIVALLIPVFLSNAITPVQIAKVEQTSYTPTVFVNGYVEEKSKKDVFINLPLVPSKVNFKIGDSINTGDVIAEIDSDATKNALMQMADAANFIPQEYMEVLGSINVDEKLIKDYIPTEITAPASGLVTSISLVEGAISVPNTSVTTIVQSDGNRVRMSVNEVDADKIKAGNTVVFKASATEDFKYTGIVERVFPTATKAIVGTSQATVVGLYVDLNQQYQQLRPGYTVTGVIRNEQPEIVHVLPYDAVLQDKSNKEYVYVIKNSRAVRCYVETGRELGNGIEIISPSIFGQPIIKNANDIKKENSLIQIVNK